MHRHKNTYDSQNYHDESHDEIEFYQRNSNDTQHQNNAHPKSSAIDCDGVLLTNAQCHMAPISILWYR